MSMNNISDKLQFSIVTGEENVQTARIALFTGNLPVEGYEYDATASKVNRSTDNAVAALEHEGYKCDCVLAQKDYTVNGTDTVKISTVDSSKSLQHAINYLRLNPRNVKKITFATRNTAFYNTSMSLCSLNPFHKEAEREIDLNQYYLTSQFQRDKIELFYNNGEFQINDCLFWAINVPSNTMLQVTIEFYAE